MIKVCFIATFLVSSAYAYGGGYNSGYNSGLSSGQLVIGGLSNGAGFGDGGGLSGGGGFITTDGGNGGGSLGSFGGGGNGFLTSTSFSGGRAGLGALPIVRTPQRVEFIRVPQQQQAVAVQPAQLLVDSQMNPISLVYRSHGAAINILQKHIPSKGTFRQSQSEEEPSRHLHVVNRPVIQEVHEIITPMRRIVQEIRPVQEEVNTIIAKASPGGRGGGGGGGSGHGLSGARFIGGSGGGGFSSAASLGTSAGEYGGLALSAY